MAVVYVSDISALTQLLVLLPSGPDTVHSVMMRENRHDYHNLKLAEREGFEPSVRFWRTHTFQACSLNHSDTSPIQRKLSIRPDNGQ